MKQETGINVKDCQDTKELYALLQEFENEIKQITSPEELEMVEREVFGITNRLGELILQQKVQTALDSTQQQEKEAELIRRWPGKMKSEGYETVRIITSGGSCILIRVRYYRRSCDRRNGKRYKGIYGGLILLGIHERCTPHLTAIIGAWSALLSSFEEVKQVLAEQGITMGVKVIRKLAYRYADRARVLQQAGHIPLEDGETLNGRRVVVSLDGGRIRLREKKRGPKTKKGREGKGRTRYKGAWREPKLLIIYVVDDQGKLEKSFSPFIDGCIKKPDVVFQMLEGYLSSLSLKNADRVLFVADGARWIWKRIPGIIQSLGLDSKRIHELIPESVAYNLQITLLIY